eukprot:4739640-Amphidinium_carterae.1
MAWEGEGSKGQVGTFRQQPTRTGISMSTPIRESTLVPVLEEIGYLAAMPGNLHHLTLMNMTLVRHNVLGSFMVLPTTASCFTLSGLWFGKR